MPGVPIGRRNLFADRRRATLGIAGVSVALLMVVALDGIFAGAMRATSRYIDSSGADLIVSQRGVRTMHMSSSALPLLAVDRIREIPGVRWADPILYDSDTLIAGDARELAYLIGFVPGGHGGPVTIVAGHRPGAGEVVLDERAADTLGVGLGGRVEALGRSWRVAGLTTGMTNIVSSVAYVPFADFAAARGLDGIASYVLVGARGPDGALIARIESATALTAQTRAGFSDQERLGIKSMTADLMRIMTFAAFLVGLAVVGLTLYAATLSRLSEIGVVKALGATSRRLARLVLAQAAWTIGLSLAAALLSAAALGWAIAGATFPLVLELDSVLRTSGGAIVLGALGALAPLIKVVRVDPATVFRR